MAPLGSFQNYRKHFENLLSHQIISHPASNPASSQPASSMVMERVVGGRRKECGWVGSASFLLRIVLISANSILPWIVFAMKALAKELLHQEGGSVSAQNAVEAMFQEVGLACSFGTRSQR